MSDLANDTASADADADAWVTPARLIGVLTTVLVPLIFGIIVVVGVIGNILVILVVTTNRQMRNTTNALILNLALADLLFIVFCVPFTATDYSLDRWPFGLIWCQAVQYLIYVTSYVSIYTLILMSFDRFLAVVFPVSSLPYRTVTNAFGATFVLWVLISTAVVPVWFAHHLQVKDGGNSTRSANSTEEVGDGGGVWCRFSSEEDGFSYSVFQVSFFVSGYAIPLVLIVIMYIFMLNRLWHPVGRHQFSHDSLRNKRRVTKLVMVVILVFAVCWAPIQLVLLLRALKLYSTRGPQDFPKIIFQILSHVLAYVNSCVNPILYAFLSDNFRKAFHQLLPACCHRALGGVAGAGGVARRGRGGRGLQYELTTLRHNSHKGSSANGETRRVRRGRQQMRHTTSLKQQLQHGGEGGGGGERERLQLQQRRSRSLVAANAKDKELEELMRLGGDDLQLMRLRGEENFTHLSALRLPFNKGKEDKKTGEDATFQGRKKKEEAEEGKKKRKKKRKRRRKRWRTKEKEEEMEEEVEAEVNQGSTTKSQEGVLCTEL